MFTCGGERGDSTWWKLMERTTQWKCVCAVLACVKECFSSKNTHLFVSHSVSSIWWIRLSFKCWLVVIEVVGWCWLALRQQTRRRQQKKKYNNLRWIKISKIKYTMMKLENKIKTSRQSKTSSTKWSVFHQNSVLTFAVSSFMLIDECVEMWQTISLPIFSS